jgi:hypothetical protein
MLPRRTLALLCFLLLFVCAEGAARADTFVLQNVSGTMTFINFPQVDDFSSLAVAANDFSASAFNNEVRPFSGFNNSVSGNTAFVGGGSSSFMGQGHSVFAWGAGFDGFNVTGSIRWINLAGMGETIHTFGFTSAGTLSTEVLASGATRYRVTFAGPAQAAPAPEPITLLMFGTGLAGVVGAARRRRKAAAGGNP